MMMNEEKQPVDVSEQSIVFSGYIWFLKILFLFAVAALIKIIFCFISSLCLFVKTNRGRYICCV